jgi:hypothetical protein
MILRLLIVTAVLGCVLHADWKIVTRTGDITITEYFKGSLIRTESLPGMVSVLDYPHRRQVNWRTDLRQYAVVEWPPQPPTDSSPGATIVIERNTTDTGERRQFFGRTARHLVTRMTRNGSQETQIDGWYIDVPGLPGGKSGAGGAIGVITSVASGAKPMIPRIEMKQTGPVPGGLPVRQRTTFTAGGQGASRLSQVTISEVTELVESTLPEKLFHPPDGYQRVGSLPYPPAHMESGSLQAHWQKFKNWLYDLFAISH